MSPEQLISDWNDSDLFLDYVAEHQIAEEDELLWFARWLLATNKIKGE